MYSSMGSKHFITRYIFYFVLMGYIQSDFLPNRNDYNAYGIKIAMNDHWLVLAQNKKDPPKFFIQFAPFSNVSLSTQCTTSSPSLTDTFIYTVVTGKKQTKDQMQFYFAGELTNNKTGIFVGLATYNRSNDLMDTNKDSTLICNTSLTYRIQFFYNYSHQEYYILGVDPYGRFTYGFSNAFIFIFDSTMASTLDLWDANLTWPDATFIPHAVDISDTFGVVAGFIFNGIDSPMKYSPMIYLIHFNTSNRHPYVVDQYQPLPNPGTWQDLLTNADANVYSAKYDMSVSISEYGDVLVGMQFINRVFLLSVSQINSSKLNYISRHTNGRTLGNGKSIAWLQGGIAALIVNVYTLNYDWVKSQVHIYDIRATGYNSNSTPLSIFPNNHQKLPQMLDPVFIHIVSSNSSLALLDVKGRILIFLATPPGYYVYAINRDTMPMITRSEKCLPGTYKNHSGIQDCTLCPTGTKNPGNSTTACLPCSPNSFCPLGSVHEVPESALETINQSVPYPESPDSVSFDEILINNMFTISTGRCLFISPLFWTLIVGCIGIIIIIIMEILQHFIKHPRGRRVRKILICTFRHTDLIGEGELWVGGLASFSILVLVCFASMFSHDFANKYPIETSSDFHFACDRSIRNAKFETSIQSLTIPLSGDDNKMFDLLDEQPFTLNVNFVNTVIKCDAVSIDGLFGTTWSTIRWVYCNNTNYTLTLSILLPYQYIAVRIEVSDTRTIGALRIGLSGPPQQHGVYTLRELNFYETFSKNGFILARTLPVSMSLTKVVNETISMDGEQGILSGIYIPTFMNDYNSLFFTADQFIRSTITLTTLTVVISETPYYVKNLQQPIAKSSEIVFQNLLFFLVCLELFGLIFLSYKMILKPLYRFVLKRHCRSKEDEKKIIDESMKSTDPKLVNTSKHTHVNIPLISYF